jgi:hypothetical protein
MDSSPESHPRAASPAPPPHKGTIVGFPQVVPLTHDEMRQYLQAAHDAAAAHPERWSQPPPSGALPPIVPCDEPEEEEVAVVMPSPAPTPPPVAYPGQPYFYPHHAFPAVAPSQPPVPAYVIDDPVILPMRRRREGADATFRVALFVIVPLILVTGVLLRVLL